jgi:hypothetical protein
LKKGDENDLKIVDCMAKYENFNVIHEEITFDRIETLEKIIKPTLTEINENTPVKIEDAFIYVVDSDPTEKDNAEIIKRRQRFIFEFPKNQIEIFNPESDDKCQSKFQRAICNALHIENIFEGEEKAFCSIEYYNGGSFIFGTFLGLSKPMHSYLIEYDIFVTRDILENITNNADLTKLKIIGSIHQEFGKEEFWPGVVDFVTYDNDHDYQLVIEFPLEQEEIEIKKSNALAEKKYILMHGEFKFFEKDYFEHLLKCDSDDEVDKKAIF